MHAYQGTEGNKVSLSGLQKHQAEKGYITYEYSLVNRNNSIHKSLCVCVLIYAL